MNKIRLLFTITSVAAAFISCSETELPECGNNVSSDEPISVPITLTCELLEPEKEEARSMLGAQDLRRISNVNYYLFRDGYLAGQEYFPDLEDFIVTLPSSTDTYNLYLLANVGEYTLSNGLSETSIDTAVHYDYMSPENFFNTISEHGFPMSAAVTGFSATSSGSLSLKRLVHTLFVRVNTEGLENTTADFTSLSIRNAARDVFPFAKGGSKAQYIMDGDAASLSGSDMDAINNGEKVTLFLLENMRGELFPGNSDWKKKTPAYMPDYTESDYCSYVELTASVQTPTAYYDRNIYRTYIGESAADCNTRRHSYFTINNNFTDTMIADEEWRKEIDNPEITGQLAFMDSHQNGKDITKATTYPGFVKEFFIYKSHPNIAYTLSVNGEDIKVSEPEKVNGYYDKVRLTTNLKWGDTDRTRTLTIRSDDGLIMKTMAVESINGSNNSGAGITIDPSTYGSRLLENGYTTSSKHVVLNTSTVFKEPVAIKITVEGEMDGYLETRPNGLKKDPLKQYFTENFSSECKYYATAVNSHYPAYTGTDVLPLEFDIQSCGFDRIRDHRSPTSLNNYNGNKTVTKTAHPTDLNMEFTVEIGGSEDGTLYPADNTVTVPIKITKQQYTTVTGGEPYGAGTDWDIRWHHSDHPTFASAETLISMDIRYKRSTKGGTISVFEEYTGYYEVRITVTEQRINTKFNGTDKWTDNPPKATVIQ